MIIVLPLLRRTLTTFNVPHWLLDDMMQPNPTEYHELVILIARQTNPHAQPAPDPKRIKKTLVFVDGLTMVRKAVQKLREWMMGKGCTAKVALQTVEMFASITAEFDKARILNEFQSKQSRIRILVATSAFGMGMNIRDIERVVQYGMNIDHDLGDIYQRVGRAACEEGRTAVAVIFLPYWYFDYQGREHRTATANKLKVPSARNVISRRQRTTKNATRHQREASRQQPEATGEDDIHYDSSSSSQDEDFVPQTEGTDDMFSWDNEDCVSALSNCQVLLNETYWTKDELEKRAKITSEWRRLCNSGCHRDVLLTFTYLQEEKSREVIFDRTVPEGRCCKLVMGGNAHLKYCMAS